MYNCKCVKLVSVSNFNQVKWSITFSHCIFFLAECFPKQSICCETVPVPIFYLHLFIYLLASRVNSKVTILPGHYHKINSFRLNQDPIL